MPTEKKIELVCSDCGKAIDDNANYITLENGDLVCEDCQCDYCTCNDCNSVIHIDDSYSDGNYIICQNCYDNDYFTCRVCNHIIHNDNYAGDGYCNDCWGESEDNESDSTSGFCRGFSKKIIGKPNKPQDRTIGLELEVCANYSTIEELAENLPKTCGLTEDGSISSGIEILTPPLLGSSRNRFIERVCKVANRAGASIDRTCGLHVHIGAEDYIKDYNEGRVGKLQKLLTIYSLVEDVFYAMMPPSRLINSFCKPVKTVLSLEDIQKASEPDTFDFLLYKTQDKEKIAELKKQKYVSTRYTALNIHALLFRGNTIEVRYHSGTINAEKIKHWIDINLALFYVVDMVGDTKKYWELVDALKQSLSLTQKLEALGQYLPVTEATLEYIGQRVNRFNRGEIMSDNDNN